MGKYDDIIGMNRPASRRQKMSLNDRAAQFAPFAALTNFGDEIKESNRKTVEAVDFDESYIEETDFTLREIERLVMERKTQPSLCVNVKVRYFIPDEKKSGGSVREYSGNVKKIDRYNSQIVFDGEKVVNFSSVLSLEITD